MKLQYLAVMFIIIMMPIFLITSFHIQQQIDTINLQTVYNQRLQDATREAIQAFEVNTVIWNPRHSEVASAKRRDVSATVSSFVDSLTMRVGVPGMNRSAMEDFVPAVAFVMYDGFYIYAPTYVPRILGMNNEFDLIGVADIPTIDSDITTGDLVYSLNHTENRHILRPFMRYDARYRLGGTSETDIVVNYTLDNYISIYGRVQNVGWVSKAGYLIDEQVSVNVGAGSVIVGEGPNTTTISGERLIERVVYLVDVELPGGIIEIQARFRKFDFVYDTRGEKIYFYDRVEDASYYNGVINPSYPNHGRPFRITDANRKAFLGEIRNTELVDPGDPPQRPPNAPPGPAFDLNRANPVFTRFSIPFPGDVNQRTTMTMYRLLNPGDYHGQWFIRDGASWQPIGAHPTAYVRTDFSAVNYYVEARAFTNWVQNYLGHIEVRNIVNENGEPPEPSDPLFYGDTRRVFARFENGVSGRENIFSPSTPGFEDSVFTTHKGDVIRKTIEDNVSQAISSHAHRNHTLYNFVMPLITPEEWEQIKSNITIVTFVQGIPIGTRQFNSYAIATSTRNREFVNENEIFFTIRGDEYYHRRGCRMLGGGPGPGRDLDSVRGHRSVDFMMRRIEWYQGGDFTQVYHFLHNGVRLNHENTNAGFACYFCIVSPSSMERVGAMPGPGVVHDEPLYTAFEREYLRAVARERFVQRQTIR
ncbi:MAG: hypothetical protein FWC79_05900 [Oscillospiraceae bacterium]|nr:hypothetical protein [Oscillospiraceae bacterium]